MPVLPEEDRVLSISGDCQLQHRARGGFSEWFMKTTVENCQGAGAPLTESGLAFYLGRQQQLLEEGKIFAAKSIREADRRREFGTLGLSPWGPPDCDMMLAKEPLLGVRFSKGKLNTISMFISQ